MSGKLFEKSIIILSIIGLTLVLVLTGQNTHPNAKPAIATKVDLLLDSAEIWENRNLDSAVNFALCARELASKHNYTEGEVLGLSRAALCMTYMGEPMKMQEIYNQAIYTGRNLTNKSALIYNYFNMGISYRYLFQFEKSYYYYQQGMDLVFNDIEKQSEATLASMYSQLAYLLFRELNDSTVSIDFLNKAKDLFYKDGQMNNYLEMYIQIGDVYRYNRNHSMSRLFFDSTRILLEDHYDITVDATYNKLMAALLFDINSLAVGLDYLRKAETLFKEIQHYKNLADVYTMFAFVASGMGETNKCLDYNEKALALRKQLGHQILLSSSYSNLANNYFKLNQFEKAFDYQRTALSLALKSNHHDYSNKYAHSLYMMFKKEINMILLFIIWKLQIQYQPFCQK